MIPLMFIQIGSFSLPVLFSFSISFSLLFLLYLCITFLSVGSGLISLISVTIILHHDRFNLGISQLWNCAAADRSGSRLERIHE